MSDRAQFRKAFPYQASVLTLPVCLVVAPDERCYYFYEPVSEGRDA